jgi:hypothetical protein
MLTFVSSRGRDRMCDGLTRRNFLRVGAIGLGGLSLASLLRLEGAAATRSARPHKGIISVYLQGGPPHLDMYDMKPDAPSEYRGPFSPNHTNVPGIDISEMLPLQAKIADKLAIVRNMQFQQQGHAPPELMTGWVDARRPAMGSFISKLHSETGAVGALPPYVSLDRFAYPGFLGAAHMPFVPGDKLDSLTLPTTMPLERLDDRKSLLSSFDRLRRDVDDQKRSMAGVDAFTHQAMAMVSSSQARDALDVQLEPQEVRDQYGPLVDFLRARRLVEAGVSFVELTVRCDDLKTRKECRSDWDFHEGNFTQCDTMLPPYDQAVSALVSDIHERGLERDVCVLIWGEMGRTPRINDKAGRDHWPQAGFAVFAGGGLKTGQVIGATDARAEEPIGVPYTPQNVLATLYQVLGIDAGRTTVPDLHGRPMYLLDDPKPIRELL